MKLNIDYICNTVYKNNKLDFILTEEGRIKKLENNTLRNEYYIKDIPIAIGTGNVRVCFTDTYDDVHNRKVKLLQTNAYYPFGMTMTLGNNDNKYKYNGKELQDDFGLDWYDYGARFYDAEIGRFTTVDPFGENEHNISLTPYHFVSNNPLLFIDLYGLDWFYYKAKGDDDATYHWQDASTYKHTYSYTDENGEKQTNTIKMQGTKSAILFEGSMDESLSEDGKLTGEGANPANVTVFGPSGADDVQTYRGLTVSSDPSKYSMLKEGQFEANYSPMYYSLYGDNKRTNERGISGALTYSLSQNGKTILPVVGGINKYTGLTFMSDAFIHRTDWNGKANKSSKGCLLIDGRQYRRFERQISKAMSISVTLRRKGK